MDPCSAAVITELGEKLDIMGLIDFVDDLTQEALDNLREGKRESFPDLYKDILEVRNLIESVYEKKYGEKLVWKTTFQE